MKKIYFLLISLIFALQIVAPNRLYAQCPAPIAPTVSVLTQNSVVIAWQTSNVPGFYNVRYQTAGNTTWSVVNNVSSPVTLTGLNCGSVYVGQVQQVCPQTSTTTPLYSDWTNVTFTTPACQNPCPTPAGLLATNMSQTGVVLGATSATSTTNYHNIRYRSVGSTNWTTLTNVSLPYQLGNLPCGTAFEWQTQQVCGSTPGTLSGLSAWSFGATFSTLACPNPCVTPTGSSTTNITQTSAVLSWNPNIIATPSIYNIRYRNANSTTWIVVNNAMLPYQLGNLTCGTGYIWQVQQVCTTANEPSPWSIGTTFSTPSCAVVCEAPSGLSATNINQTSAILNWNLNSTTASLYNLQYHSATSTTWITINNVTMPYQLGNLICGSGYAWRVQRVCSNAAGTTPTLSDWTTSTFSTMACTNVCEAPSGLLTTSITQTSAVLNWNPTSPTNSLYNLQYHSATSNTWITLNNVTMPYQLGNLTCGSGYAWRVQRVCSNGAGTTTTFSDWTTSTFSTTACPIVCETPSGLITTNNTQTSAVLNWNANSTSTSLFNIQYHSATSNTWILVSNVTMPYTLGNLSCGSGYVWQVQRVCATNPAGTTPLLSPWSIPLTFSTSACSNPCTAPIGLSSTNVSQTGAVLSWGLNTTSNNLYNIRYRIGNTTTWIVVNNASSPYQLGNLPCGTGFEWQVQQVCVPNSGTISGLSPWSVSATFSTLACQNPCAAPTQLSVSNTTQNSVVITWATPNTLTQYNVQYRADGNPNWIVLNNVSSPLTLTGLNCGAAYIFQVQQVCTNSAGSVVVSPWSSLTFTTPACPNPCVAPIALSTTNISQSGAVLHWGTAATIGVYNIRYRIGNATTWIVVNNVSSPFQLGNLTCGTGYVWQVQQVCNPTMPPTNTSFSPWSVSTTFSTMACPNPCVAPIGLTASNSSQTGVVLSWLQTPSTGSVFNIRYRSVNSSVWITLNNVSMPYQLGNLPCGTGFVWQVQQVCGPVAGTISNFSPWSVSATFSTLACTNPNPCAAPIGLTASNSSQTGVVLSWGQSTSTGSVFNIRYRSINSSVWITLNNVTMPHQLGNLPCGTGFVWQVQQVCGPVAGTISNISPWSVSATFSTLACTNPNPCAAPIGLSTTNINQNSVVLNWGPVTTTANNSFNIRYRSANSSVWIVVNNVSSPYQLGNISCSSGYVWQVQRICVSATGTDSELSQWSLPITFSTSPCNSTCAAPTELAANDITQTNAILNWGAVPGAVAYIVSYKPLNNTSGFITVTSNTNSISVIGLTANTSYTYQVKAICANGTVASNLSPLSAPYIFATPAALVIYPNPANELLRMSYLLSQGTTVTIQLRDSFGQLVMSANEIAVEGSNEFKLNTSGISEGIYLLTVITNSDSITSKVYIKH